MNSKKIECFLCVAECLNISYSAQKLYASQSTISRQISIMEEELGFPLFVRGNNYLRLTPAGAYMYQTFQELTALYKEKYKKASALNQGDGGSLKIGFYCHVQMEAFLSQIIQQFRTNYPKVELMFECIPTGALDVLIRNNVYDVVFVHSLDVIPDSNILYERICNTHQFLLYGATHPLAEKENLTFVDFGNEIFWSVKDRNGKGYAVNRETIFRYYGIEKWNNQIATNLDTILLNVQLGNGCMFMDPATCPLTDMSYKKIELPEELSLVGVEIAWNKDNLNPVIPLFVNQFIDNQIEL